MRIGEISLLWLLALLPLLWGLYHFADQARREQFMRFADESLWKRLVHGERPQLQFIRRVLISLAIAFMVLSLIQPKWGFHWEEVKRIGLDIVIAFDVSKSMLAEDVRPSRLERAKLEIKNFMNQLNGDRIGIVAFAGTSFLQCPLTLDYSAAKIFLDAVDTDLIPEPGTDLAGAIRKSLRAFEAGGSQQRVMILITDGENHTGSIDPVLEEAKKQGVIIYTIGIGSQLGAPIPIIDASGAKVFLKDRSGEVILSKADSDLLLRIAVLTGGKYGPFEGGLSPLEEIYEQEISKLEKQELGSARQKKYENRFQWPLTAGLVFLLLESILALRRRDEVKI